MLSSVPDNWAKQIGPGHDIRTVNVRNLKKFLQGFGLWEAVYTPAFFRKGLPLHLQRSTQVPRATLPVGVRISGR
jgi:hypothetical protein